MKFFRFLISFFVLGSYFPLKKIFSRYQLYKQIQYNENVSRQRKRHCEITGVSY